MLLAINIGNTNVNLGVFTGLRLVKRYAFATKEINYYPLIIKITERHKIENTLVCSVVPQATKKIEKTLKRALGRKALIIGKDITVPLKNSYRHPRQVGQDRLVNAYAGLKLYGAPLIVVDFGTGITFDIISKQKAYLGGMILPGMQISLDCLAKRTALLPQLKLAAPKEFIGRDTKNSMLSGIVYGFSSLTDAMIKKIKSKIGPAKAIGTGGNIKLIKKYSTQLSKIDSDLTLKGLNFLYQIKKI